MWICMFSSDAAGSYMFIYVMCVCLLWLLYITTKIFIFVVNAADNNRGIRTWPVLKPYWSVRYISKFTLVKLFYSDSPSLRTCLKWIIHIVSFLLLETLLFLPLLARMLSLDSSVVQSLFSKVLSDGSLGDHFSFSGAVGAVSAARIITGYFFLCFGTQGQVHYH